MKKINRRKFLGNSLFAAAGLSLPLSVEGKTSLSPLKNRATKKTGPDIIDTNVNLFEWPFSAVKIQ